jgi:hypothetical protein
LPTDSTDPRSAHVGGSRDIGQDSRVGGEPEERQNRGGDTPARRRGQWPLQRSGVLDWLINETRQERFLDNIFGEFCRRLRADGIPVARAVMQLRILHPQWFGTRVLWRSGTNATEL